MFSKLHVQCTCTQLNDNYNNFVICRSAITKLVYLREMLWHILLIVTDFK